jgi:hypothetical protein
MSATADPPTPPSIARRRVIGFPTEVNDVAARTVASVVFVTAVAAVATRQAAVAPFLAYGFVARVLSGPRFSPLAQLATRVVAPRLARFAKLVPGPPKRFAQAMGAAFTLAATGLWLAGAGGVALVLLGVLAVPAFLEAAFGYCIGCRIFALLMRAGVVPESTCAACADLWGPAATARRAARADY